MNNFLKLDLTKDEKLLLTGKKISLHSLVNFSPESLEKITKFKKNRCMELIALAKFQIFTYLDLSAAKESYIS